MDEEQHRNAVRGHLGMIQMYLGLAIVLLLGVVGLLAYIAFNGIPVQVEGF